MQQCVSAARLLMELKELKLAWKTGGMISENSTNQEIEMNGSIL